MVRGEMDARARGVWEALIAARHAGQHKGPHAIIVPVEDSDRRPRSDVRDDQLARIGRAGKAAAYREHVHGGPVLDQLTDVAALVTRACAARLGIHEEHGRGVGLPSDALDPCADFPDGFGAEEHRPAARADHLHDAGNVAPALDPWPAGARRVADEPPVAVESHAARLARAGSAGNGTAALS